MRSEAAEDNTLSQRSAGRAVGSKRAAAASGILLTENKALISSQPSLLESLSAAERERVLARGHRKVFYRGAMVFSQGGAHTGIFIIETGRIRVFYSAPSGKEITLAYWNPGNFVGGPEVFGGGTHVWSGVAAANSSVFMLPGRVLRELIVEIPALAIGLIDCLEFKGKCYSALAQILGTRSVGERLAHLLLQLSEIYGVATPEGTLIDTSFTHADFAHIVGATRQWVTMTLKRLQNAGVLANSGGRLLVRNRRALAGFSDPAGA